MKYCNNFRHDLEVGQLAEKALAKVFENSTIEVKNDLKAPHTGNLFIEYMSRGKLSGISTTEADFWCFYVQDVFMIIPTDKLKEMVEELKDTDAERLGGDNDTSMGVLLKITDLLLIRKDT
tara:strand:+ start:110 stop:472 length:363 start_codon:yes stop_codon:yes gene_type:complete